MTRREEKVLAYVNRLRVKRGHAPIDALPKGRVAKTEACTLACAFAPEYVEVDYGLISFFEGPTQEDVIPPKYVSEFIEDFDDRKFPHLISGSV